MKKTTAKTTAARLPASTSAAPAPTQPAHDSAEVNGRLLMLVDQRNSALNENVMLAGKLGAAQKRIKELEADLEKAKPKPAANKAR